MVSGAGLSVYRGSRDGGKAGYLFTDEVRMVARGVTCLQRKSGWWQTVW